LLQPDAGLGTPDEDADDSIVIARPRDVQRLMDDEVVSRPHADRQRGADEPATAVEGTQIDRSREAREVVADD